MTDTRGSGCVRQPDKHVSPYGRTLYRSAQGKLADQIGTASKRCAAGVPARPQLIAER